MSQRDLTVLGCSSQVPTRHRNHNGYLLRWDGEGLLFDPGEGTQRQFIYANLPPTVVTRVFITHFHGDHCLGMAGMFQRLSLDRVPHPVHLYYPAYGRPYLDRMRRASVYHDQLEVVHHPIEDEGLVEDVGPFRIEARWLDHPVDALGYRIQEPDTRRFLPEKLAEAGVRGPLVGQLRDAGQVEVEGRVVRLEDVSEPRPGASFAFVMDTRVCPGAVEVARDADLLVIESTFLDSEARQAREYGHLTAREAATIARDAGARKVMLAHFSQRYRSLEAFEVQAREVHDDVVVAKDLLTLPFPRRRR